MPFHNIGGAKTSPADWVRPDDKLPSDRFWSPFDPSFTDIGALLRRHVQPGSSLLEIGFVPGKYLAFAALKLGASVSGVDYCPSGVATTRRYFDRLGVTADLRLEDAFFTTFEPDSFDCVFSAGLIEHFDDPRPIVAKHVELARPGGKVIVLIPNYGGIWGRLQGWLEPENLAIHNLTIMFPAALARLFPAGGTVEAFAFGRPSLWICGLHTIPFGRLAQRCAGLAGTLLPTIPSIAPNIAAVFTKAGD